MDISIGVGCLISAITVTVAEIPDGWRETVELTVVNQGQCDRVDLTAPRGAISEISSMKIRAPRKRSKTIKSDLVQFLAGNEHTGPTTRFHLGGLDGGHALVLKYTHDLRDSGPYVWSPNADEVVFGEITAPEGLTVTPLGPILEEDGWYWADDIQPDTQVSIEHSPSWTAPSAGSSPDTVAPEVSRTVLLNIDNDDPLASLALGASSMAVVTDTLRFQQMSSEMVWFHTNPPKGALVSVEWNGEHRVYPDGVLLLSPPNPAQQAVIQWHLPDAPTFGNLRPSEIYKTLKFAGEGVTIHETGEGDFVVHQVGNTPIIQNRARFLQALAYRFRAAMMVAPPAPVPPDSASTVREKIAYLTNALKTEVTISDTLPAPPLHPRPIRKAKRSGIVTPVEAALILAEAAEQLGISATWALFRPDGKAKQGDDFNPTGYTDALVRFDVGDHAVWVAPSCGDCAPLELPPEAWGTPVLSTAAQQTPSAPESRLAVSRTDETVSVTFEGAPALLLRRSLSDVRSARRTRYLLDLVLGGRGKLVFFKNIDKAGATIKVIAKAKFTAEPLDPFQLPTGDLPARTDMLWTGTRTEILAGNKHQETHISQGAFEYKVSIDDYGRWSRALTLSNRFLTKEDILALRAILEVTGAEN